MKQSTKSDQIALRRRTVAVIGDASCQPNSKSQQHAQKLGTLLVDAGYRIITGGMGGTMQAAGRGARASKRYQEGDTVGLLPGHASGAANPFVDIVIPTGLDYGRNYLVAHSDAVVAIGGGAGTLSEICYAWMHKRLIIALGEEGWAGKLAGKKLDWRIRYKEIPDDRIYAARKPQEVIKHLRQLLPLYHASTAERESGRSPK
jgi:uncharacterized protein (TIGR00725 family)